MPSLPSNLPFEAFVKIGDTLPDIEEVSMPACGPSPGPKPHEMGLTQEEVAALDSENSASPARASLQTNASKRRALLVDSIAEVMPVLGMKLTIAWQRVTDREIPATARQTHLLMILIRKERSMKDDDER